MFRDREDAGRRLAERFRGRPLTHPVVLAIPRGGLMTGAVLAQALGAELDVVLSRKLRAPMQREYAIGAVSEDGRIFLNEAGRSLPELTDEYITRESQHQLIELERRKRLYRAIRPHVRLAGRSVIVADDGIATGSSLIAALQTIRSRDQREIIVAVPVAAPDRLAEVRRHCDDTVCLLTTWEFWAVGQFFEDFTPVAEGEALDWFRCRASGAKAQEQVPA